MDSVTLKLIDRQKRIRNKMISYFGLFPLGLFFIGCFYIQRYSVTKETFFEREFDFESYWRVIGVIGLFIVGFIFLFLDKLLPFKKGIIHLTKTKITIDKGLRVTEFHIDRLKDFEFKADVAFDTDDRHDFQKASILKFRNNNKTFQFEIGTDTKSDLGSLTPIIKAWKEINSEFRYSYK